MRQFEIGDIINYKVFYNGVQGYNSGIVSSEKKADKYQILQE